MIKANNKLSNEQKEALIELETFLQSTQDKVFILKGMTQTGKSFLVPYIQELANRHHISQVSQLALSHRIIENLFDDKKQTIFSIYSYLYDTSNKLRMILDGYPIDDELADDMLNKFDAEFDSEVADAQSLEKIVDCYPVQDNTDNSDTVYIIDEAQLISNTLNQTDNTIFGTGRLLDDLINYTDLRYSQRKLILIGDPYQIIDGKNYESALNDHQYPEKYLLPTQSYELTHAFGDSGLSKECTRIAQQIQTDYFNTLQIQDSKDVTIVPRSQISNIFLKEFQNGQHTHVLCFSNETAQKTNLWIKKHLINRQEDLAAGDLLVFHRNIEVYFNGDQAMTSYQILKGHFVRVIDVDPIVTRVVSIKDKAPVTLSYRSIRIELPHICAQARLNILENYRLADDASLPEDEQQALAILETQVFNEFITQYPYEYSQEAQALQQDPQYRQLHGQVLLLEQQLSQKAPVKTALAQAKSKLRGLQRRAQVNYRRRLYQQLASDPNSSLFMLNNIGLVKFAWAMTVHRGRYYKWDKVIFNLDQGEDRGLNNEDYFRWVYTGLSCATQQAFLLNYRPINPFSESELKTNAPIKSRLEEYMLIIDEHEQEFTLQKQVLANKFNIAKGEFFVIKMGLCHYVNQRLIETDFFIDSILHTAYQALYILKNQEGDFIELVFSYNKKGRIKRPGIKSSSNKQLAMAIRDLLMQKQALTHFDFIKDPWREQAYTLLHHYLQRQELEIVGLQETDYKDTVYMVYNNEQLHVDMYYTLKGSFSTLDVTACTHKELINRLVSVIQALQLEEKE